MGSSIFYNNVEAANLLYPKTGAAQQPAHQSAVRGLVKLQFAAEVTCRLADSIGVDAYLHVQDKLGELIQGVETIKALLLSAEYEYETTEKWEVMPNAVFLETIRGLMPTLYPRAIEVMQTLGAGGLLLSPTGGDFESEELREDIERYYVGREGVSAEERVKIFKFAWDLCGEAFGQRLLQYERYYTGDPIRKRAIFYNQIKRQRTFDMVDEALKVSTLNEAVTVNK